MKKFDWSTRRKNKTFLVALSTIIITTVYQLLALFEITPKVSEGEIAQLVSIALNILVGLGVIINPTTDGITDKEE